MHVPEPESKDVCLKPKAATESNKLILFDNAREKPAFRLAPEVNVSFSVIEKVPLVSTSQPYDADKFIRRECLKLELPKKYLE